MNKLAVLALLLFPSIVNALPLRTPSEGAVMTQITSFRSKEVLAVMELLVKWESDENVKEIWLKIDTNGGNIENGMSLVRLLEVMKTPVVCVADYKAYSFGMVLLQHCPERVMTKRSVLMVHDTIVMGIDYPVNSHELSEMAQNLEISSRAMMHGLLERLKMTEEEYREKLKGGRNWWLDYTEAIKYGAIDAYASPVRMPPIVFPKFTIPLSSLFLH